MSQLGLYERYDFCRETDEYIRLRVSTFMVQLLFLPNRYSRRIHTNSSNLWAFETIELGEVSVYFLGFYCDSYKLFLFSGSLNISRFSRIRKRPYEVHSIF